MHHQDLEKLMSAFTARPWRQGLCSTLTFLFRTKAASARRSAVGAAASAVGTRGSRSKTEQSREDRRASADATVHVSRSGKPPGHAGKGSVGQLQQEQADSTAGQSLDDVEVQASEQVMVTVQFAPQQPGTGPS